MTRHEWFCQYPQTRDTLDLRPATCGACRELWDASRGTRRPRDLSCWGLERGSAANTVANLVWVAVLIGAVILVIVVNV